MTAAIVVAILLYAIGAIDNFQLDLIFLAYAGWALTRALGRSLMPLLHAVVVSLAAITVLAGIKFAYPAIRYMPYLVIVPANLLFSYLFARGPVTGREPILLRLISLMGQRSVEDPRFRSFVTMQCLLWSVLTLATALLACASMVMIEARPLVSSILTWLVISQVIWFALSHYYASFKYDRPETWLATLKAMSRPEIWRELRT